MTLKDAIDVVRRGITEVTWYEEKAKEFREAFELVVSTAEAVEKWRGKLSDKKTIEDISAEIHKCYCRIYERNFRKPYWTNGDYSKLDEATKDYDREMAKWHLERLEDCASAYVANLPQVEDVLRVILDINQQEFVENSVPYSTAALRSAKAIHDLIVGKVSKQK